MTAPLRSCEWTERSLQGHRPHSEVEAFLSGFNGSWKLGGEPDTTGEIMVGSRSFNTMLLTRMHFASVHGMRDRSEPTREGAQFYSLTFNPSNAVDLVCNNTAFHLRPSEMFFWSSTDDVSFRIQQGAEFANVLFPRHLIDAHLPRFRGRFCVFNKANPARDFTGAYFRSLAENAKTFGKINNNQIESASIAMLLNLLHANDCINAEGSRDELILADAHALIEKKLKSVDLDPQMVATEVGVSLRKLHYLFRRTDETVMGRIRNRRLESARYELADPGLGRRRSITEVAYRWAFADPAQFCRAFKQAYGITPGAFRARKCENSTE
jgi:AraC-like DNA-binding protein